MDAVHEPPRRLLDQGGPEALDVLLDAPGAFLGREALVPGHAPDFSRRRVRASVSISAGVISGIKLGYPLCRLVHGAIVE